MIGDLRRGRGAGLSTSAAAAAAFVGCMAEQNSITSANSYRFMRFDKFAAFVISITTNPQKKRNMLDRENDKSSRLPAPARQS
jgi:hypothetical protein